MLQRLIYKEPKPLKPLPKDPFIFNKEGKVRGYFVKLCEEIHIDSNDLYPKTVEEFAAPDITPNIQTHRYNNYENKRRAKIEALKQIARHRYGSSKNNDMRSLTKGSVLITNLEILAQAAKDESKVAPSKGGARRSLGMDTENTPRRMSYGEEALKNIVSAYEKQTTNLENKIAAYRKGSALDDDFVRGVSLGGPRRKKSSFGREDELMVRKKTSSIGREGLDDKRNKFGGKDSKPGTLVDLDMPKHERGRFHETDKSPVDDDDDATSVAADLEDQFQHYLVMKAIEKERIKNAHKVVGKIDEEYREKARLKYEEKQKKFDEALKKKEKDKQGKQQKKEEILRFREEKISEIRRNEQLKRKQIYKNLIVKIDQAEKKRNAEHESRLQKLNETNASMMEKSMYATMKKWDTEHVSPTASLESIERKLAQSYRNRERIQLEKMMQLTKHGYDVEEKLNKARHRENLEHQQLLQKTVTKMMARHKSTSPETVHKNKKKNDTENDKFDYLAKIEWKRSEVEREEKEALKEFKEKEKQRLNQVKKKRAELTEYIRERKEIIKQKNENVRENLSICKEAEEKKNSHRLYAYQDKYHRINDLKKTRHQQIVKN